MVTRHPRILRRGLGTAVLQLLFEVGPSSSTRYNSVYIWSAAMQRPPDPQLLGFLEAYDRHISDLALALREVVLEEAPDASESIYQVYTVAIWFGFSGKMKDMFCYIATNAGHVNLGFPRGTSLPDPNRVLEGEGKTMRHIKFRSQRDVERPLVRRYIRAAMEQAAPLGGIGTGKSLVKSARGTASRRSIKKARRK
jgi:hypothetical protein